MKKNILYLLLILMVAFQACQDDPAFPDPNFEIQDQRVTVRRDTADFYTISMNMNVPNGVQSIELLDATDYTAIAEITDYKGKTKFDFAYDFDLTDFESDTVINLMVRVLDNDSRAVNQGLRLDVRGFSKPEIKLIGGTTVALAAPAYVLRGIISTGLNPLSTVTVSFDGKEKYFYEVPTDTVIYEMVIDEIISVGALANGVNYTINVTITDESGQSETIPITIFKSTGLKRPLHVDYVTYNGYNRRIYFEYNADDLLSKFVFDFSNGTGSWSCTFSYNDAKMVETIEYIRLDGDGSYLGSYGYRSHYYYKTGTNELEYIGEVSFDFDEAGNEIADPETVEVDQVEYNADGNITAFNTSTKISNVTYADPFGLGEGVFAEYWQASSYMTRDDRRQHFTSFDPVYMPSYSSGMPPIFVSYATLLPIFNDLVWPKYMMTGTVNTDPSNNGAILHMPSYSYETDEAGNITLITKVYHEGYYYNYSGDTETYSFVYE